MRFREFQQLEVRVREAAMLGAGVAATPAARAAASPRTLGQRIALPAAERLAVPKVALVRGRVPCSAR